MKITFISHSTFLVESAHYNILFDWTGETPLPDFDRSKHLYVFNSHHHGDHYTPRIFALGMDKVTYILATCIRLSAKRKAGLGIKDEAVVRMKAGEHRTVGDLDIRTVRSNDAGVAFLVSGPDGSLFHAGDLNDWSWQGEDPAWLQMIGDGWRKSLAQLEGVHADAAFLPLDGRLAENFWLGLHGYLQVMDCGRVFPMHCWGDFSVVERLKAMPESGAYRALVADITADGQVFTL